MNATLQLIRRNPWPYAIIGWFLIFGSAMAAWVVVAVRNDPDLVRADYYEHEIGYQKHIDRLNRTAAFSGEVSVAYEASLRGEPSFADAHYNLALLHESLGRAQDAIRHMSQYRRLVRAPAR